MMNHLAVITAGIAAFVLGWIFYCPKVMGKTWMKLAKVKPQKKMGPGRPILGALTSIITAYALAKLMYMAGVVENYYAIKVALLAAVGIAGMLTFGGVLWERKPVKLWVMNTAFNMVSYSVMALIIVNWG